MEKKNVEETQRKKNDPQFMAFGKKVNRVVAMAAIVFLLLIVAIVFVIVLAFFLQS